MTPPVPLSGAQQMSVAPMGAASLASSSSCSSGTRSAPPPTADSFAALATSHGAYAAALAEVKKDIDYVSDTGVAEDRDITMEIQKGLASGANEHFVYGHFEAAIVHFHKVINELMPKVGWEE